jgi:superfamily II DNA or RNA helicase
MLLHKDNLGNAHTSSSLSKLNLLPEYNTEENNAVDDFYKPCLSNSVNYDRAVGYFRSSIYKELGEPLLDFALKGGKTRIICSPDIPIEDEVAARRGYDARERFNENQKIDSLLYSLKLMSENPDEKDCLEMLSVLIQSGSLELFIALRDGGIFHRKIGRFKDESGNFVIFSGSSNETYNAVTASEYWGNDEEFDVYRSWGDSEFESRKAESKSQYLERLLSGGTERTKVRHLNEIEKEILNKFRKYKNLEECRTGARKRLQTQVSNPKELFYYQKEAIMAWEKSGRNGILSMPTGTGKTLTALFAVKPLSVDGLVVLIVVPTKEIFDQWVKEVESMYLGVPILLAGAGNDWKSSPYKRMFVSNVKRQRFIIATMDTASSADFIEFISQSDGIALVADEVHRIGSTNRRKLLSFKFKFKLGLSATPERLFDKEGNKAIIDAFGNQPVYELGIGDQVRLNENSEIKVPILGHFLSKYYYDFEIVELNETEQSKWDEITIRYKRLMARSKQYEINSDDSPENDFRKLLLIERARIIKSAKAKILSAVKIISERYPRNGRWLIYCDTQDQMNEVWRSIASLLPDIPVLRYYSEMSLLDRSMVLSRFEESPGIIVSIKCLDEGVNIPSADGAVILASSTNPREYIQRRGRVLRHHFGKGEVTIIDIIVLPNSGANTAASAIIRSELSRAYSFASFAINKDVTHRLWKVCQENNVIGNEEADMSLEDEV